MPFCAIVVTDIARSDFQMDVHDHQYEVTNSKETLYPRVCSLFFFSLNCTVYQASY